MYASLKGHSETADTLLDSGRAVEENGGREKPREMLASIKDFTVKQNMAADFLSCI